MFLHLLLFVCVYIARVCVCVYDHQCHVTRYLPMLLLLTPAWIDILKNPKKNLFYLYEYNVV